MRSVIKSETFSVYLGHARAHDKLLPAPSYMIKIKRRKHARVRMGNITNIKSKFGAVGTAQRPLQRSSFNLNTISINLYL